MGVGLAIGASLLGGVLGGVSGLVAQRSAAKQERRALALQTQQAEQAEAARRAEREKAAVEVRKREEQERRIDEGRGQRRRARLFSGIATSPLGVVGDGGEAGRSRLLGA